jgi:hypothetical protein
MLLAGFLFGLGVDPENGGDVFLQTTSRLLPHYSALQPEDHT